MNPHPAGRCIFCQADEKEIILQNALCYAIWDRYPVNPGHTLVIPFRHYGNAFESTPGEAGALFELIQKSRNLIESRYRPDGYNVGVNVGPSAGQSIPHVHVHVIPRYTGDTDHPGGGIRRVIPGRRSY